MYYISDSRARSSFKDRMDIQPFKFSFSSIGITWYLMMSNHFDSVGFHANRVHISFPHPLLPLERFSVEAWLSVAFAPVETTGACVCWENIDRFSLQNLIFLLLNLCIAHRELCSKNSLCWIVLNYLLRI